MRSARAALVAVAFAMIATASTSVVMAAGNDSNCVDSTQDSTDDALQISFVSRCESAMKVNIQWTLECKGGGGTHLNTRTFRLEPGATSEVLASAATCGDHGWNISGVTWSYQTSKGD